ncbi:MULTISPECIES: pro-sigmaK processing inhibitor BofA family protein [Methanobacterium]|jgi:inhibitor of the pro-sigma K processing machinery|uniref:Pro-sigmaK processing inhibitor BofA family protein n=1 Tax=Methanobacterium veterum TaxID=408577 RepID=A0A9E5A0W2_9EURY|nr:MULTISPECIES: pro-sigmaK processing inhibitor BofA family protein [Methanobacterium]MCZ3366105.1 pro-sigmaK processing inhibitor BofA family protein [Methanobacterium veterum]MCZ3371667.1 pro-sigmaK processing inhibitor BofA family protein [Methanobacterium veterum]
MSIELIVLGIIILIVAFAALGILFKIAGLLLKILVHVILGWIALFLVNILPFVHIPINILTVLIAGFGGIWGVLLLILAQILGFF